MPRWEAGACVRATDKHDAAWPPTPCMPGRRQPQASAAHRGLRAPPPAGSRSTAGPGPGPLAAAAPRPYWTAGARRCTAGWAGPRPTPPHSRTSSRRRRGPRGWGAARAAGAASAPDPRSPRGPTPVRQIVGRAVARERGARAGASKTAECAGPPHSCCKPVMQGGRAGQGRTRPHCHSQPDSTCWKNTWKRPRWCSSPFGSLSQPSAGARWKRGLSAAAAAGASMAAGARARLESSLLAGGSGGGGGGTQAVSAGAHGCDDHFEAHLEGLQRRRQVSGRPQKPRVGASGRCGPPFGTAA